MKIPVLVLVQTVAIGLVAAIPILFVGINQLRRACGSALFGSREHFCSGRDLYTWFVTFPHWIYWSVPVVAMIAFAIMRSRARHRCNS